MSFVQTGSPVASKRAARCGLANQKSHFTIGRLKVIARDTLTSSKILATFHHGDEQDPCEALLSLLYVQDTTATTATTGGPRRLSHISNDQVTGAPSLNVSIDDSNGMVAAALLCRSGASAGCWSTYRYHRRRRRAL